MVSIGDILGKHVVSKYTPLVFLRCAPLVSSATFADLPLLAQGDPELMTSGFCAVGRIEEGRRHLADDA
jgi:hypothetical protein